MKEMSIEEMLNQCQDACQETMEKSSEDWAPPVGPYTVLMHAPKLFTYSRDGRTYGVIRMRHEIVDGQWAGKVFEFPLFGSNPVHCSILKQAATAFTGGKSQLYAENARAVSQKVEGRTANVVYSIKPSKNGGDGFPHITYENVN